MKKRCGICLAILMLLVSAFAFAEETAPEWDFGVPLSELYSNRSLLVNRDHLLDKSYVPEDLVTAGVKCTISPKPKLCAEVNTALVKLFDAASKVTTYTYRVQNSKGDWSEKTFESESGLKLILESGYRSYGTQATSFANYLARNNGVDDGTRSPAGASEHQSGMCADVLSVQYNNNNEYMNESFYQTPEAQWMEANCARYGFIIRYPADKADVTKVPYEPWHLRYVGRYIAGYIHVNGLSLEEFTDRWQAAVEAFKAAGGDVEEQIALEAVQKSQAMESEVLDELGDDGDAEVSLTLSF